MLLDEGRMGMLARCALNEQIAYFRRCLLCHDSLHANIVFKKNATRPPMHSSSRRCLQVNDTKETPIMLSRILMQACLSCAALALQGMGL